MKRGSFIFAALMAIPLGVLSKINTHIIRAVAPFIMKAGEARYGRHFKMKGVTGNHLDLKISGDDTSSALVVFEQTGLTKNWGPPLHTHPLQDEWFYVIDGSYRFQVGEENFELQNGDTIFLPRNIPHAFLQLSDKGKMLVSYLPAGKMESFFNVTDKWTVPPSNAEIHKVFTDHDMIITGPPLKP